MSVDSRLVYCVERREPGHVLVMEQDLSGPDRQMPHDALNRGGVASSVVPDEAHHVVLVAAPQHAAEDVGRAAVGVDRIDLEHNQSFREKASEPEEPIRIIATCSFFLISVGVPWARIAPWCITTMRSEYLNTTSMSCSTTTAVMPSPRTTEAIVSMIWPLSCVLTPLVGSSRNRSLGRSAYASSTSS